MDSEQITFRLKRPNPLLLGWVEEMYLTAVGTEEERTYERALASLRAYPLRLRSGKECAILKGFGKKLCAELDTRLARHKAIKSTKSLPKSNFDVFRDIVRDDLIMRSNSVHKSIVIEETRTNCIKDDLNQNTVPSSPVLIEDGDDDLSSSNVNSTERRNIHKPLENAVIIMEDDIVSCHNDGSSKNTQENTIKFPISEGDPPPMESSKFSQNFKPSSPSLASYEPFCDDDIIMEECGPSDFNPGSSQNIQENMRPIKSPILIEHSDDDSPAGNSPAKVIQNDSDNDSLPEVDMSKIFDISKNSQTILQDLTIQNDDDLPHISFNGQPETKASSDPSSDEEDSVTFIPGSFDIILLADTAEICGRAKKTDPTIAALKKNFSIKFEMRRLQVGDFAWIARHRINDTELVLPYVVERKRLDDLGKSIKDGRYHEQKFRLKNCGLPNVTYLIEHMKSTQHLGLPMSSLMQAVINTRIQDGFNVHFTTSLENSIRFLSMMTKQLTDKYNDKVLKKTSKKMLSSNKNSRIVYLMQFDDFNSSSTKSKHLCVYDMFIKQLLQLKGVSIEKALAIADTYKSPHNLLSKYKELDKTSGQKLLSNIPTAKKKSVVGPVISKLLYQYYTVKELS